MIQETLRKNVLFGISDFLTKTMNNVNRLLHDGREALIFHGDINIRPFLNRILSYQELGVDQQQNVLT